MRKGIRKFAVVMIFGVILLTSGCQPGNKVATEKTETTAYEETKDSSNDETMQEENTTNLVEYPSLDFLVKTKWTHKYGYNTDEIHFGENGRFARNIEYYDQYYFIGKFTNYSYDEKQGIIKLSSTEDNTLELKIIRFTENSIILSGEDGYVIQYVSEEALTEIPELNNTQYGHMGSCYSAYLTIVEKDDKSIYAGDMDYSDDSSAELMSLKLQEFTKFYHLDVEKGMDKEEVILSYKYVELTDKGVEQLVEKGPSKAFVFFVDEKLKVSEIIFYTETNVEEKMDYSKVFENVASHDEKQSIIGTRWIGDCRDITFTDEGEFYYVWDGEVIGDSDSYPYYEYDEDEGIITVYDESKNHSSTIEVVEHTAYKLVLRMGKELEGGEYEFVSNEYDVHIPVALCDEQSNSWDYMGPATIKEISSDSAVIKTDDTENAETPTTFELADNIEYFIMLDAEGEVIREWSDKYKFIQLTNKGAQNLIEESECNGYYALNTADKIGKIIFYPRGGLY